MTSVMFVGDTHGMSQTMIDMIDEAPFHDHKFHVGDTGLINSPELSPFQNETVSDQIINSMLEKDVFHIRGNHDNPKICARSRNFLIDDLRIDLDGPMLWTCGGAKSTDAHTRIPGVDWVHDEELSYDQWINLWNNKKFMEADLIITHDCPQSVFSMMPSSCPARRSEISETRNGLEMVLNTLINEGDGRPIHWFFGHHHHTFEFEFANIKFTCVPQNQYVTYTF